MNTAFRLAQRVVAVSDAQGLDRGQEYLIRDLLFQDVGMFGTVVTYVIEPIAGGALRHISNGHLLLKAATPQPFTMPKFGHDWR